MNLLLSIGCALLGSSGSESTWRQYAQPEEAGWASDRLEAAWEFADGIDSAAVIALYQGNVLVAWGDVEHRFECHSVRKSLMSALLGQAVGQGKLKLESTLAELGIDDVPPLTDGEKRATLFDLVRSRSGVYHAAAKEPADMRAERPARGSHAPGEFFFYNNWDFNVLGTIYERATGKRVFDAFVSDIAAPLGMEDFRPRDGFVELAPSYSIHPAHAFRLSARDLARFGQLYLQQGRWNDRAVVPVQWLADSTKAQGSVDGGRGYGYLWWTYAAGSLPSYVILDHFDCFAAIGTGGQFLLVVPGADFVFVHRGDTDGGHEVRGEDVWSVAERVLAARIGPPKLEPALSALHVEPFSDPLPPPPEPETVQLDQAALENLVGEYAFPQGLGVRVFLHEGRLFAHRSDGDEAELLPLSESRFTVWFPRLELEFRRDAAGRGIEVSLLSSGEKQVGKRVQAGG